MPFFRERKEIIYPKSQQEGIPMDRGVQMLYALSCTAGRGI